jgi:hypothetical protein
MSPRRTNGRGPLLDPRYLLQTSTLRFDADLAAGAVELIGDESLFADFVAMFTVTYSAALSP